MGKMMDQINPATGEALEPVAVDEVSALKSAVAQARVAQKAWAAKSFSERAEHILQIQRFLESNVERACGVISKSTGKLMQDALATEVLPAVLACKWYASQAGKVLKSQRIAAGDVIFKNKRSTLVYEPVGVVCIISPWNYPFTIPFGEVIMGLMAGNAIVLKVASNVAHVGKFIEECVRAGKVPDGLFHHLVVRGGDMDAALFKVGIDKVFFTGSTRAGKELMAAAAPTLTPLCLELGGNDAMVVLADADLERAVDCACWAGYCNAGQTCGSVERVYVHNSIYDRFVTVLATKTKALRHGPEKGEHNVDVGSMTTKKQYDTVRQQLDEALNKGAKIVAQSTPVGDCSSGFFIPATVLVGCTPDMSVMREETFGPLLPVVPFGTEEEAVQLANDTRFALTSSVFSKNLRHARKIAAQLQSGVVTINDHLYTHAMSETPWGGWKESGMGRTHGSLGLREMCNVKCVSEERISAYWLPRDLWWFPYGKRSYDVLRAAMRFSAPRSAMQWIRSVMYIVSNGRYTLHRWKVDESDKEM